MRQARERMGVIVQAARTVMSTAAGPGMYPDLRATILARVVFAVNFHIVLGSKYIRRRHATALARALIIRVVWPRLSEKIAVERGDEVSVFPAWTKFPDDHDNPSPEPFSFFHLIKGPGDTVDSLLSWSADVAAAVSQSPEVALFKPDPVVF